MTSATDTGMDGVPVHGRRALALAYGLVLLALAGGAAAIAIFGHAPAAWLDLPPPPAALEHNAPQGSALTPPPAAIAKLAPVPLLGSGPITHPVYAGHALLADPALIENTDDGPLPRIADDGRKPMTAYAVPAASGKMRIAIVIGGLGLSAEKTAHALAGLPPGVTLGFVPYESDVQRWVGEARMLGHEVLLEVPMEPFDFPDSDPGPHTLRSGLGEESNTERLTWALTRFTGYVGVTNLMGGRFLSDSDSLSPVMTYLTRRGLLFFDDGTAAQSAGPDVAASTGAAFAKSNENIDSIQTALEIDRHLSNLEDEARAHGSAIGSGYLYPVTVQRVALWARGLSGRGFVLVPISAMITAQK
ncbi:MAG TPA: divergent polysaccharide deacetylase family protein [Rhizomicrobium sp.]